MKQLIISLLCLGSLNTVYNQTIGIDNTTDFTQNATYSYTRHDQNNNVVGSDTCTTYKYENELKTNSNTAYGKIYMQYYDFGKLDTVEISETQLYVFVYRLEIYETQLNYGFQYNLIENAINKQEYSRIFPHYTDYNIQFFKIDVDVTNTIITNINDGEWAYRIDHDLIRDYWEDESNMWNNIDQDISNWIEDGYIEKEDGIQNEYNFFPTQMRIGPQPNDTIGNGPLYYRGVMIAYDTANTYMNQTVSSILLRSATGNITIATENNTTSTEVVDIPGLMFTILGMPFAWISTAFNLTLFPGTIYEVNIAHIFFMIIGVLIMIFIIKKLVR